MHNLKERIENHIVVVISVTAIGAFAAGWAARSTLIEVQPKPQPVPTTPIKDVTLDSSHFNSDMNRLKAFVVTGSDSKPTARITWHEVKGAHPVPQAGNPIAYAMVRGEEKGVCVDIPLSSKAGSASVGVRIEQHGMIITNATYPIPLP